MYGLAPEGIEAGADLRGRRIPYPRAGTDHEVGRRQAVLGEPERVADYATKSVTGDGISDHFGGQGDAEPRVPKTVRSQDHAEKGVAEPPSLTEGGIEVGFTEHPA